MSETRILVAGLPSTGKTTYIAALWNYVKSTAADKSLTLDTLAGSEHEYLNSIGNDWLEYKDPSRSLQNKDFEKVIMQLKKTANGEPVKIEIPDMAGEKFRDHFDQREWTVEFDNLLNDLSGMILFVNPSDCNNRPKFISDAKELERILDNMEELVSDELSQKNTNEVPHAAIQQEPSVNNWDIKFVPNQVKLVELLQLLNFHKLINAQVKISLIISAWDQVQGADNILPEDWLAKNLPLLHQYILCNTDKFNVKYFGISAQGCDYNDEPALNAILHKNAAERIIVKEGTQELKDIAKPVIWMTE